MQTVTQIIAGGGPPAAARTADASAPGKAFPSTLQRAMTSGSGKTLPDEAGQAMPDGAETSAAETADTAVDPAIVATLTDAPPTETTPTDSTVAAGTPPTAAVATPVPIGTPPVAHVLRDIAAGRSAASRSGPPSTSAAAAESISAQHSAASRADDADGSAAAEDQQVSSAPATPLPLVVDPQTAPNPVAAAATQHAREVVLTGPAAAHATGLLSKASTTNPAPTAAPEDTTALHDTQPAATTAIVPAGGDAAANSVALASVPSQGAADAAALGAPALLASAGTTAPPPAGPAVPTGTAAELNIAAPPGSPQFGPELGERLLWLVRDGLHEARLQLNPRELGPVEVRLSVADGAAHVSFSAQHAGTAAAVQQSLPQLRELLSQQGLQLGQATVSHQLAGDGQAAQQQAQRSGGQPGWDNGQGSEVEVHLPTPSARIIGRGLVDAYA